VKGQNTAHARFQPHQLLIGIKDPKLWLGALMIGVAGTGIGAFSVFMPTFIEEFGFGAYTQGHEALLAGFWVVSKLHYNMLA
jgi:hypothetical protein